MALKLWYPFIKDLSNNGYPFENIKTYNNIELYENGKMGKCAYFNGGSIKVPTFFNENPQEMSLCAWLKATNNETNYGFHLCAWGNNMRICFLKDKSAVRAIINKGDGTTGYSSILKNTEVEIGKWYHIAVTYKNGRLKIYINGDIDVQHITATTELEIKDITPFSIGTYSSETASCYVNDYRLYDHCLSDAEVKEISKGLILHYTMDNISEENKVYDSSGFGNDGIPTDLEYSIDRVRGLTSTKYNGSTSRILTPKGSFAWFTFDEFTISCWMKPTVSPSTYTGSIGVSYDEPINPEVISAKTLSLNNHSGSLCIESIKNNQWKTYNSGYSLAINEWQHCVVTVDKNNLISFYVNGVLVKTDILDFGSNVSQNQNAFFQVGCDLAGGDEYYQGYYDDIRFYTTTLSADDILQLYKEKEKIDNQGNLYCSELNEVERRVEYLESTGTQYIDTGIISISNKFQIEMQFSLNQSKDYQNLFCCRESSSRTRTLFVKNLNGFRNDQDGWQNVIAAPLSLNTKYILKSSQTQFKLNNNVLYNYQSGSGVTINRKVTLLNSYDVGNGVMSNTYQFNGKIYYCKIWDNDTLVRDFLPTISTEEGHIGEACLFDTVTNTYFYNQGTGKFITNLDESTTNIDFTSKGIVNTDYIIEGNDTVKIKNDGNIIEVNEIYEN